MQQTQVFLGGSCDPTTWRRDISIPLLENAGVSFYNPQISNYDEKDAEYKNQGIKGGVAEVEAGAKEAADTLLFVIDGETRAIASILEATEYICTGRDVVLVITNVPDGTVVAGQTITGRELKDLNRARGYLKELAGRHNVKLAANIEEATQYVISNS